jgi:hypothetical protein
MFFLANKGLIAPGPENEAFALTGNGGKNFAKSSLYYSTLLITCKEKCLLWLWGKG